MLKEAFLTKISGLLKIDLAKLKTAFAAKEEEEVEVGDDLTVFSNAELKLRDDNQYGKGKDAGSGMIVDGLRKKHSLEFTGSDPEKLVEAIQRKTKSEIETNPDVRIVDITKLLEATKKLLLKANENADHFKNQMENSQTDTKLLSMLPNNRSEVMNNYEYLSLIKSNIKIETKDGKQVAIRNGEIVVDPKTGEPIAAEKVIEGYFAERKGWLKEAAAQVQAAANVGRGGGNSVIGGKYSKVSDLRKELESEGLNANGEEYTKRVIAAQRENKEMNMNA